MQLSTGDSLTVSSVSLSKYVGDPLMLCLLHSITYIEDGRGT